jgi:hypothetical protein
MLPRVQARIGDYLAARAQDIWTRQFSQHDASQSITNAGDAQQKIAFRSQVGIIVDRQCDGFVDRSELAREVRDRRISQGLSLRVDNAAVLAIPPFRQTRDDARSNRLQLAQPTGTSEGGAPGEGLNNSQYSRMRDASIPSVLLRPNLVRTKSRIWAGLMMLTI